MPSGQKRSAGAKSSQKSATTSVPPSRNALPVEQPISRASDTPSNGASPTPASLKNATATQPGESAPVAVNRKKQKRREKQAARLAAEQQIPGSNGVASETGSRSSLIQGVGSVQGHPASRDVISPSGTDYADAGFDSDHYDPNETVDGDDLYYTDDEDQGYIDPRMPGQLAPNGWGAHGIPPLGTTSKKNKNKKNKSSSMSEAQHPHDIRSRTPSGLNPPQLRNPLSVPPPLSNAALRSAHSISRDRIWNTSTQEERERIKEFWLSLGEEERRSLVKVEKEAVLRKMKEQQKHSCSCTVCGRKRTAIEEELEVLYDAYYEELEQYANHTHGSLGDGPPMMPPPRMYNHTMPKMAPDRMPHLMTNPSRGRIQEVVDDDVDGEEEYDEEEEDEEEEEEEYSDEDPEDDPRGPAADFFAFGNSLTVQGAQRSCFSRMDGMLIYD